MHAVKADAGPFVRSRVDNTDEYHINNRYHARVKVLLVDQALDLRLLQFRGGLVASGQIREERCVLAAGQGQAIEELDYIHANHKRLVKHAVV